MSFGFIEHFIEWEKAIDKHWELLNAHGYLIIGVPVFGLFQLILRRLTCTPEKLIEVLESHNQDAMNLSNIMGHIKKTSGAQIVFAKCIHNMDTWITPESSFVRPSRRWVVRAWHKTAKIPRRLRFSSSLYSPYALIIAKKLS